ncbi:N-acyl-D-amino-acid deacylase family protein [Sphingobium subterraneum]|uniref:N-acyl-D-aspartate/D-glutamate deacylase n=1 Tax=Sphingobium subterraneum TaxID=627688 RepID=A0A841IXL5_9SPHN|nr:amidohydrolase family protein [Sphingobium subterraneum]MBB6123367.1 N-acyl-D-aspartate/D-glutamate deacylase [Sphingobium subterraneum]
MYDLIIRNGVVIDGSGASGYRADVAIQDGRIAAIGQISGTASRYLDADGQVVTPGFIDGHTHLDAQMFWDPLGSSSCWQGITTAVMGNCGFTLAPSSKSRRGLVVRNLERAEDISGAAMEAGIDWRWTTFREYLDVVDSLPKGINYASNIGHSALRTFVMGEAAFERESNEDEFTLMRRELDDALSAGAIGFTTSRGEGHNTSDDRPVASRLANWDEVRGLVMAAGQHKERIFEFAPPSVSRFGDLETRRRFHNEILNLSAASGVTITWGLIPLPEVTAEELPLLDRAAASGAKLIGQSHSRGIYLLYSFLTDTPYDWLPEWKEIRSLPLAQQREMLQKPDVRSRLVAAAKNAVFPKAISSDSPRPPDFSKLVIWQSPLPPNPVVQDVAAERGVHPIELMIDLAVETNMQQFFYQPGMDWSMDSIVEAMRHEHCVMTFSDAGAHVTQQECSLQTYLLAHWVRQRQEFTLEEAVRMITLAPAKAWGFHDRGLLREGMAADINVFDPALITPTLPNLLHDLPTGAPRLESRATGILATIVGGEITIQNGEHTGALPGRLLRRLN